MAVRHTNLRMPVANDWKMLSPPGHNKFAFDLVKQVEGRAFKLPMWRYIVGSRRVEESYSWGELVIAPTDGEIADKVDTWRDKKRFNLLFDLLRIAYKSLRLSHGSPGSGKAMAGNYLIIKSGDRYILLAHLKRGSIRVSKDDTVNSGQPLAEVGCTGASVAPHLHIQVMDGPDPLSAKIIPLKLK